MRAWADEGDQGTVIAGAASEARHHDSAACVPALGLGLGLGVGLRVRVRVRVRFRACGGVRPRAERTSAAPSR